MKHVSLIAAAGIAGALATPAAAPVFAQIPPGCSELCAVSCIKPISIPDRWDDVTPIPGYAGVPLKNGNWRNNGQFDQEAFTDTNGNSLHDDGESFEDKNLNGIFDSEAYGPLTTGYIADANPSNPFAPQGDLGLVITLHPGLPGDAPNPGQYLSIDLPAINRGTPLAGSEPYGANFDECNPTVVGPGDACQIEPGRLSGPTNTAFHELIAQDPDAYWDPVSKSIAGSAFGPGASPRILRFPIHDPRIAISSGLSHSVLVTKVVAFFMEATLGSAQVQGRFMRSAGEGEVCVGGSSSAGFVIACATPATPMSWGRVKGIYR